MWVRAMEVYYHVAKVVEPKRANLRAAEAQLAAALAALQAKQASLQVAPYLLHIARLRPGRKAAAEIGCPKFSHYMPNVLASPLSPDTPCLLLLQLAVLVSVNNIICMISM